MKIIDAHSHIDYITHRFQPDVVGTICCATTESQWRILSDLMKSDLCVFGAFGVHPWFVDDTDIGFIDKLENLLCENPNFMVGEIGIDKYKPNIDKQTDFFEKQFDLAVKYRRTVSLHCVGAWDKILHILKKYKQSYLPNIIAHAYSGNMDITKSLLNNQKIFFSFNKIDISHDLQRISQIPANRILVESDAKQNIDLISLINKISEIKNEDNISGIIYDNAKTVIDNE